MDAPGEHQPREGLSDSDSSIDSEPSGAATVLTKVSTGGDATMTSVATDTVNAPASQPALLAPRTAVGRYIVLGHLGSGGMGVVYKAYDPDLNRQIALKLVRVATGSGDPVSARERLLREAQGLARLSHPNVVSIYDVGLFEDGVFLAMELVEGLTLRAWLKTKPRYQEKIRVFIAAGQGLAAAHQAGLVHRDFKPANVILGNDGRPRVLDFGLVRAMSSAHAAAADDDDSLSDGDDSSPTGEPTVRARAQGLPPEPLGTENGGDASQDSNEPQPSSGSSSVSSLGATFGDPSRDLDAPLTQAGSVLGTPRYMSPEQLLGQTADAQSDQFGFCVALYEGLFGKAPFGGKVFAVQRDNICEGRLRPPPSGSGVPSHVRRLVLKGLARHADDRHDSMGDLLAELSRDPAASRRRWALALGAAVLAGLAGLSLARPVAETTERCPVDRAAMQALWSPAIKAKLNAAFAATGLSYATESAERVGDALDRRAGAWAAMQQQSCEATWVQGTQSEALLDLRSECLAERRLEQAELISLLSSAELSASAVDRSVQAATGLPAIEHCADAEAIRATYVQPPPGAAKKVADLRQRLARVRVRWLAGEYRDAAADAEPLVAEAASLNYPPLESAASYELARSLRGASQYAQAQTAYEQTMQAAGRARDDRTAALAVAEWLWVVGYGLDRPNEALISVPLAQTLAARADDDVLVQMTLRDGIGACLFSTGDYAGAEAEYREALALMPQTDDVASLWAPKLHNNIGLMAQKQDRLESAIFELGRARDLWTTLVGPNHPDVGIALVNLGSSQARLGKHDDAVETYREALRIATAANGPEHLHVAEILASMAASHRALGNLGAAANTAERSLEIVEGQLREGHASVAFSARVLADVYLEQGEHARAVELYRKVVAAFEPSHPNLVPALLDLGRGLSSEGKQGEALTALERAVRVAADRELPSLPDAEAALARQLWRTNRKRARSLAGKSMAAFEAAGREDARDELARWLANR